MDDETLQLLKATATGEAGLPENASRWVHGQTISELRQDAHRLAEQLGYGQARDDRGSGTQALNHEIRRAAGYPSTEPEPKPIGESKTGQGGTAAGRPQAPQPGMTALLRGYREVRRQRILDAAGFHQAALDEAGFD